MTLPLRLLLSQPERFGLHGNFTYLITGLRHPGSLKNRVEELDDELLLFAW